MAKIHIIAECCYFTINEIVTEKQSVKRLKVIEKLFNFAQGHYHPENVLPEQIPQINAAALTVSIRHIDPTLFPA